MAVYKRGNIWWYHFTYAGQGIQESAKTTSKTVAREAEKNRRRELEDGFSGIDRHKDRVRTFDDVAEDYLKAYRLKHLVPSFAEHCVGHVRSHLGTKMVIQISATMVCDYQVKRLSEKAAPKSINEEVGFLLRIMGERGDLVKAELKRKKMLKLAVAKRHGKAFDVVEKDRMLMAAGQSRSPLILPALTLALNAGMRDAEIRTTRWSQINFSKLILTVGKSKTAGGEGRTIPLNSEMLTALQKHAKWYAKKFGELKPQWFVFPFLAAGRMDPNKPVTTLKTAWKTVRKTAEVEGRWHDNRHTLITELAESGAGDETIMAIAGHVSRQMLSRYSHIRTEAKRTALEDVVARRQTERNLNKETAARQAAEAAAVTVN